MEHLKVEDLNRDYIRGWTDAHHDPVELIQFIGYTENDGLPDGGARTTGPVLVSPEPIIDGSFELTAFLKDRFKEAMSRFFDDADDHPVIGVLLAAIDRPTMEALFPVAEN